MFLRNIFVLFLIAVVLQHVAQCKSFLSENEVNSFLNAISCNTRTYTIAVSELVTSYRKCAEDAYVSERACMFPCIANEMGLIVGGKLMKDAVSGFLSKQFKDLDGDKQKNWTDGIKICFNQYESNGEKFPTEYKDCKQHKEALSNLWTCVLLLRGCEENPESSEIHRYALFGKPRTKRAHGMVLDVLKKAAVLAFFPSLAMSGYAIYNSQECGKSGCYKGYCYSYCGLSNTSMDWCYTTKTFSQSFEYVKCNNETECDDCWKCAGSCTLGY